MKLSKSLAELDAAADEMLAKSEAAEDKQDNEDEVTPEEVSDSSTPAEDNAGTEGAEDTNKEDIEKCDTVKKSEEPENADNSAEEGEGENISKSCEPDGDNVKKSEGAEEDEEESEPSEPDAEDIEKSIKEDFEAEDIIKKGMDNSEFCAAMIEVIAKSMGDMQYDTQVAGRAQSQANDILAKSLQAVISANNTLRADNEKLVRRINKLEKSISQGFEQVMDSLDEISSQPAHMRKSMASVSVHDRDFVSSLDGSPAPVGFESLSKSQVLTALNNELYSGNQNVTPQDIISYESGAPLRPDLQLRGAIKSK